MDVPINVVFFRYYTDDGRAYLARTWLLDDGRMAAKTAAARRSGAKEIWNEQDWYVSFGEESGGRGWDDARAYGFISAGGGEWFSETLKKLPLGARIFTSIPKAGYVGVGSVTGTAQRFDTAVVIIDGQPRTLADLPLNGKYAHPPLPDGEDREEYVVPVAARNRAA